jgi:hypothetical protein
LPIEVFFQHLRSLIVEKAYVVRVHAAKQAHSRTLKLDELRRSAQAGTFQYVRHEIDPEHGNIEFRVRWHDSHGNRNTAIIAMDPDLTCAYIITLWS